MPIYEFKCKNCDEEFEFLFMPSDLTTKCPKCGKSHGKEDRIEMSVSNFKLDFSNIPI